MLPIRVVDQALVVMREIPSPLGRVPVAGYNLELFPQPPYVVIWPVIVRTEIVRVSPPVLFPPFVVLLHRCLPLATPLAVVHLVTYQDPPGVFKRLVPLELEVVYSSRDMVLLTP